MAEPVSKSMAEKMLDTFVNASDEPAYAVAYKWEVTRTNPPWWAPWRKPIVTRSEVLQPGRMAGHFEKGEDQFGNPELVFQPDDPSYASLWNGWSKIVIVTESGTELATQRFR